MRAPRGEQAAAQRLVGVDQALLVQIECDARSGLRRALATARLQQLQMAVLGREFEVLHVTERGLQPRQVA